MNISTPPMKFSVLISTYEKEHPLFLERVLLSIWDEQSLKPNEIVLVEDGPLTDELYKIIKNWKIKLCEKFKIVSIKENKGAAIAKNKGLEQCAFAYVAIMDSDDISLPHRFEKQIHFIKQHPEVALLGSDVQEFYEDENKITSIRKVPSAFPNIKKHSKYRMPVNHPSVIFKKQAVLEVGNYQNDFGLYEDWFLVNRLLAGGYVLQNIPECLLKMRTKGHIERRMKQSKFSYKTIFKFNYYFYKRGYYSFFDFLFASLLQSFAWSMPTRILKFVYKYFLRKKS